MTEIYDFVRAAIEQQAPFLEVIADDIWDHPETRFEEHWSSARLADALAEHGFQVEWGAGGMSTAFIASAGSGRPVIALLGEFDALAGLSQQAGCAVYSPLAEQGNGHGCGHNLLGTAALGAAIAIKNWLEQHRIQGTVRFYGCPGEEGGSGKTFMVRDGAFEDVDAALSWHPEAFAGLFNLPTLANIQAEFSFHGIAAHAANSPHLGRSALDAVTLMTVGTNFLNEHIIQEARVHYAITHSGGISPNVVQADASVLYLVRAPQIEQAEEIYQRVMNVARGAALMTDTTLSVRFDKACSNYQPNRSLEALMYQALTHFGTPEWSPEEQAFAAEIRATVSENDVRNGLQNMARTGGSAGACFAKAQHGNALLESVAPYQPCEIVMPGSTDVGDVSWVTPVAQCFAPCFAMGTPLHTWQLVAQGRTSIAHKGMILAAKTLAATALHLLAHPKALQHCRDEFLQMRQQHAWRCPIPDGVQPSPLLKK